MFAKWAEKYFERGYGVIPVSGKAPIFEGWQRFCERLPNESEMSAWVRSHPNLGIGLPCGPANNIIALDIDSYLDTVINLCPSSPVKKVGKKGETRFFQWTDEALPSLIGSKGDQNVHGCVEILGLGRQTVLPPSVHPDTQSPYVWSTPETLFDVDASNLPKISYKDLIPVMEYYGKLYEVGEIAPSVSLEGPFVLPPNEVAKDRTWPHGSQDRLKKLSAIFIQSEYTFEEAARALVDYEKENHFPSGYFSHQSSHSDQRFKDPYANALAFYSHLFFSINKKRERSGASLQMPPVKETRSVIDLTVFEQRSEKRINYPEPRGLMKDLRDAGLGESFQDHEIVALGGAIAFLGAFFSNRYQGKLLNFNVTPNVYILNIITSGGGKNKIQKVCRELAARYEILGSAFYKSDVGIVQNLPKQQERLDVIDEATSLLRLANSTKSFETGVCDTLTSIFSCADSKFDGLSSGNAGVGAYAVYRPHISILGSTTPAGFKSSVGKTMSLKGLMPRFLMFYQRDGGDFRVPVIGNSKIEVIQKILDQRALDVPKRVFKDDSEPRNFVKKDMGFNYSPMIVPYSDDSLKVYLEFAESIFNKTKKLPEDDAVRGFYARFAQHAAVMALLDSLSLGRQEVQVDSIDWGIQLVQAQWQAAEELYDLVNVENEVHEYAERLIRIVKRYHDKNNGNPMPHSKLIKTIAPTKKWIREEAFSYCFESQRLFKSESKPILYSAFSFRS